MGEERHPNSCIERELNFSSGNYAQPAFDCSKLTVETPEQCVKSVQS